MQQLVELGRQVEQLQLSAAVRDRRVGADQLADAGRVDRGHAAEVEQDVRAAVGEGRGDDLAQLLVARADRDLPIELDDFNSVNGAGSGFHVSPPAAEAALLQCLLLVAIPVPLARFFVMTRDVPPPGAKE